MRTVKINGTNYNVLEVTKTIEGVPVTCTIILDDFDVIASYQGEFDLDVITEIVNKKGIYYGQKYIRRCVLHRCTVNMYVILEWKMLQMNCIQKKDT